MEQGDWQTAFDLENCFFHVRIAEEHQKYLGFSITHHGVTSYYQFRILIYGLSPAVSIITILTKPLIKLLHSRGIRISILIDDGRILARSEKTAWQHLEHSVKVFQRRAGIFKMRKLQPVQPSCYITKASTLTQLK